MGRAQRISFPGALFHITVRGNNKEKIFLEDKDFKKYLKFLKKYKKEFSFKIYAYVLMPNHIHILIQISDKANVSKIMQALNTAYAKYFCIKYKRVGHLYQGRFHSIIVDKDEYLLTLTIYIHLNPVRAGIVLNAEDYFWSSCRDYLKGKSDFLDLREVLNLLSNNPKRQIEFYQNILRLEAKQKDRQRYLKDKLEKVSVLGSEEFCKNLFSKGGTK